MTFSLLARDPESGALGCAAATGNLCVGAWVLRGKAGVGISASQGHYPSTLWGETVLDLMAQGNSAEAAVNATVAPDPGRETRQLLALDHTGHGGSFSGSKNLPLITELKLPNVCTAGNMLSTDTVIPAMADGYLSAQGSFARRLLAGLYAAANKGGDLRGLMSAAILIVTADRPPIDLRIDHSEQPLGALESLLTRIEEETYANWTATLPSKANPWRTA